jgi:hypothetical protein
MLIALALALSLTVLAASIYTYYSSIENQIKRLEEERDFLSNICDHEEEFEQIIKQLNILYKKRFPLIKKHLLNS